MSKNEVHRKEAIIFGKYLLGSTPDEHSVLLYVDCMNKQIMNLTSKEERILNFIHQNSWSLPFIDAGLTSLNSKSHIRKKMFSMLAILEASPHYTKLFLPQNFSALYPVFIFFTLAKSVLKSLGGVLLLAVL